MLLVVLIPLIIAFIIPFLSKYKDKIHTGIFVTLVPLGIFLYFLSYLGEEFSPVTRHYDWVPSLNMSFDFHLDGLSLLFVLLISGIGTLVALYSIFYLSKSERLGHFYVYLLMFMTAMLGIVLSDNVYVLYTFWELTSISSFLLIGYWHFKEESRYGAMKSLLITVFGGLSLLGAFILLTVITGTTSINQMISQSEMILGSSYLPLILILLLLGAFTKSAQFPFHIWLPDAMEAPTPVSAYLHSATMVKAGIYLVARFSPIFQPNEWFFISVSGIGIITLCWASYMALQQTDLKGILAFSTISQLGMIMAMLGYGTPVAALAAIFHILNHATFKGSLFMIAGIIDHETGTRDIRKLGGLMTLMPISATLAFFGTFSMAGVPLPILNGYYSKELFFESSLHDITSYTASFAEVLRTIIPYLAVLGSTFTFIYSMYLFFKTFTGQKNLHTLPKKPHEAPFGMLLSPAILVLGIVLIALFPNTVKDTLLTHAVQAVSRGTSGKHIAYWHGIESIPFWMSVFVVVVGTLLFIFRKKWMGIYNYLPGKLSLNRAYDLTLKNTEVYSRELTGAYMNGSARRYVGLIATVIFSVTTILLFQTGGFAYDTSNLAPITSYEILIAVVMSVAALGTVFSKNNLTAIIVLGVVGYGLSVLFVLYRAPDLALTQLVVETITVALFLLCFKHLPKLQAFKEKKSIIFLNGLIAVGFGGMLTLVAISSHSTKLFPVISDFFLRNSYEEGGGTNVVNVILVDFRGLDTLFEIAVLGLAALGIYGLIKLRHSKGAE